MDKGMKEAGLNNIQLCINLSINSSVFSGTLLFFVFHPFMSCLSNLAAFPV